MEELAVRISNQLKMISGKHQPVCHPEEVVLGKFRLYPRRYELLSPAGIAKLSQRDMEVLSLLVANRNHTIGRKQMLLSVWGDDSFFN